ncbi:MAG: DnaJ domain-containing protein [Syntrophaceae bacterium]|nr:DnaJ domain-containing protein [Syntrophaceae bacterium]
MSRNRKVDNAKKFLGIPKNGTAEDAKKQYKIMAKIWHPDVNREKDAHIKMQVINEAYAFLMKEEFGILDPWEDYNRWWWRQYGNDPIWGNYYPEEGPKKTVRSNKMISKDLQGKSK